MIVTARRPIASDRMHEPRALDAAYRAAVYRVRTEREAFELRVEAASRPLAALLRRYGVATAAYLTACNPYGVRMTEAANRAANEALRAELVAADAFVFDGEAVDPTGASPSKRSFLALGIALATARALGMRFRQNALLFADDDAVPRLVWLPRP